MLARFSFLIRENSGEEASWAVWAFYIQVAVPMRLPDAGRLPVINRCSPASEHFRVADDAPGIMLAGSNLQLLRAGHQRTTLSIDRRGLACAVHFG